MKSIPTAFLDVLFVLIFFLFFLIAVDKSKEDTPQPKQYSEFIVTVTWDQNKNSDIDTWAMRIGNQDSQTGFNRRENDVFILHNDNTSMKYGQVGDKILEKAVETLTIESIIADNYMLSVHGYRIKEPTEVTVTLQKTNPFSTIFTKTVTVYEKQEVPIANWGIDKDGNVYGLQLKEESLFEFLR